MWSAFLVFLGGGLGAVVRHGVSGVGLRLVGPGFPAATMVVNVAGSLAMGLLIGWLARHGGSNEWRLLAATGFLGGFTTFSAFSLDVAVLWQRGEAGAAAAYVAGSVVLSIAAVFAGLWLMREVA